jgi:hypothetical protein
MENKYMDRHEEAFREAEIAAEIEWLESECMKQGCCNAKPDGFGCSIDGGRVEDARSCKNFFHFELKEKNMGCDFCYWNSGGECKEGYGTPDPGNHCGGYIPVESTPRIEILMDSLKSALLAGDQEAVCVVDDWAAHCSRKSDKLQALRKGV